VWVGVIRRFNKFLSQKRGSLTPKGYFDMIIKNNDMNLSWLGRALKPKEGTNVKGGDVGSKTT